MINTGRNFVIVLNELKKCLASAPDLIEWVSKLASVGSGMDTRCVCSSFDFSKKSSIFLLVVLCSLSLASAESFSIAVLGDMHLMTSSHRNRGVAQTRWIAANTGAPWNTRLTVQVGDIVQVGSSAVQWGYGMDALNALVPAQNVMAVSITPGNHDYDSYSSGNWSRADLSNYTQKVGRARWQNYPWFGGSSANDRNHYQLYNAGGYTFMHLDIEWNSTTSELAWANQVLAAHPNIPTSISTHEYLLELSNSRTGTGNRFWDAVVKNNPQIFLVISGHLCSSTGQAGDGENNRIVRNSAGLEVMETLTDYQNYQAANGWTRIYTIDTSGTSNNIQARTYSPIKNSFATHAKAQFSWSLNFKGRYGHLQDGGGIVVDAEKPTAPANLAATALSSSAVQLSWTKSTDNKGVLGYDIFSGSAKVGSSTTNDFQVTGLTPNTSYGFKVIARDEAGNKSPDSNVAATKTLSAPDTTKPSIPANVTAMAQSNSAILVTWSAARDDVAVTGYDVFSGITKVGTATTTSFNHSGLQPSTTYSYRVQARDAAGNPSDYSNTVAAKTLAVADVTKPTAPANVTALAQSSSSILLSWTSAMDNVAVVGYDVVQDGIKRTTVLANSFLVTGLAASTTYAYKVISRDAAGNTAEGLVVSAKTSSGNPATNNGVVYEAEKAVVVGAVAHATYVDYINSSVDYIEWTVTASNAGTYGLSFKYALSSGNRPLTIGVNGAALSPNLAFPSSGSFANYASVIKQVALKKGANLVRATAAGSSGANMDSLTVTPL